MVPWGGKVSQTDPKLYTPAPTEGVHHPQSPLGRPALRSMWAGAFPFWPTEKEVTERCLLCKYDTSFTSLPAEDTFWWSEGEVPEWILLFRSLHYLSPSEGLSLHTWVLEEYSFHGQGNLGTCWVGGGVGWMKEAALSLKEVGVNLV